MLPMGSRHDRELAAASAALRPWQGEMQRAGAAQAEGVQDERHKAPGLVGAALG